ncbi:MAG: thioredoxin family protein [Candidatus Woesearchaeota archaeon]
MKTNLKLLTTTFLAGAAFALGGCERDTAITFVDVNSEPDAQVEIIEEPELIPDVPEEPTPEIIPEVPEEPEDSWQYGEVLNITGTTMFDNALAEKENVMVDFGSKNCYWCSVMAPFVEAAAGDYAGELWVAKVDCSEPLLDALCTRENVYNVPDFRFYRSGEDTDYGFVGGLGEDPLYFEIDKFLNSWVPRVVTPPDYQSYLIELDNALPTMVKIGAPWCGYCVKIAPLIEKASIMYSDQVLEETVLKVIDVNTDEIPEVVEEYGITGIPNTRFFYNMEHYSYFMVRGYVEYDVLETAINGFLEAVNGSGTGRSSDYLLDTGKGCLVEDKADAVMRYSIWKKD